MTFSLKPKVEADAQNLERAVDRLLKAAALVGLSWLLIDRGIAGATELSVYWGLAFLLLVILISAFLFAASLPLMVAFAVAFEPPNGSSSSWKAKLYGAVFVTAIVLLFVGLFHTEMSGLRAEAAASD